MFVLRTLQKNETLTGREREPGCWWGEPPRVMGLGWGTEEFSQSSHFHLLRWTGAHGRKAQGVLSFDLDLRYQAQK